MSEEFPLFAYRECAARLVAAAVKRLFPAVDLLGGGATDSGFFYDFGGAANLTDGAFPMIEEQLRALITENIATRSHTMVRQNARELFKDRKEKGRVLALQTGEDLVELLQIGSFYDLCPLPHLPNTGALSAIKLLEVEEMVREGALRISGTAFPSKEELKDFLKKWKRYREKNHLILAERKKIFWEIDVGTIWGPYALSALELLKLQWCMAMEREKYTLYGTPHVLTPLPFHRLLADNHSCRSAEWCRLTIKCLPGREEGWLRTDEVWADRAYQFVPPDDVKKALISSLQLIARSNKMVDLEGKWTLVSYGRGSKQAQATLLSGWEEAAISEEPLAAGVPDPFEEVAFSGTRLEYRWKDQLGRYFTGPFVGLYVESGKHASGMRVVEHSHFGSVERLFALWLEKYEGTLPPIHERDF